MNAIHKRRLCTISIVGLVLALAAALILYALKQNINVFLTPSELTSQHLSADYHFRLGGMVKKNSVVRDKKSLRVNFIITDLRQDTPVTYTGILPDLFREGTGVIAFGSLDQTGTFIATEVLAKHDENYMPKKVYQALREKYK